MEYTLVAIVALVAAGLTLFSGFGLGTLLLPAFALFFPIEIAVSATVEESQLAYALNMIWFALLVGWSGGQHSESALIEKMGVSAELVLRGAAGNGSC